MQKRVILLDVDGVVVNGYHFKPELRRCWDEHLEADLGIPRELFYREFIKTVFIDDVLTGKTSLITALDEVMPKLGYRGSALDIASYWLARDSHLNKPLLDVVKRLQGAKVNFYLATNQEHLRAMHLWQTLGLNMLFKDIFYSARIGARKPDAVYFKAVNSLIGVQETPPLMFDDTPEVVEAAQAAGWEAVLFTTTADFTGHPFIQTLMEQN